MSIHLREVALHRSGDDLPTVFPFNVPVIQALDRLQFTAPVTFLVGENGSGKSTLLEGIAAAAGSITVGSEEIERDSTLKAAHTLAKTLRLTWNARRKKGFFLRSEDFFGFVKRLIQIQEAMRQELDTVDQTYQDRSETARNFARMPYARELNAIRAQYGESLDSVSHGESFFKLFRARFVPGGLYLLDEPEAPLSPMRQIVFLGMLKLLVEQDSQFIIATHSPILLAFPGASIWRFEGGKITAADYASLVHVIITRAFLNDPAVYLERLMKDLEP